MEEYVTIISTVGFPIFAFILMYRMNETVIKENTAAMLMLKDAIEAINK